MKLCAVVIFVVIVNCNIVLLGGRRTTIDKYPFMVLVAKIESNQENQIVLMHKCSGTIISSRLVLTAAHCVCLQNGTQNYTVIYGLSEINLSTTISSQIPLRKAVNVDDVFCHGRYMDEKDTCNCCDVAILKLESPLERQYKFVMVSSQRLHGIRREGTVVSWKNHGSEIEDTIEMVFHLREITFQIYDNDTCLKANISKHDLDYYLCAGCIGNVTTSWGDSGSPLLVGVDGSQGLLHQVAVLSQGFPSYSNSTYPNCFIKLSPMFDKWILSYVGEDMGNYILKSKLNGVIQSLKGPGKVRKLEKTPRKKEMQQEFVL